MTMMQEVTVLVFIFTQACRFSVCQDFDAIIKNPLNTQRDLQLQYISQLDLFSHFPCDVLKDDLDGFFYQYFKPNTVIIKNSALSDYIVVIMSVRGEKLSYVYSE